MDLYKVTTCKFRGEPEPHGSVHRLESYNYVERVCVIDKDGTLADDIINGIRFVILKKQNGRILLPETENVLSDVTYGVDIEKIHLNEVPLSEFLKLKWYYMRYIVLMACIAHYCIPDPRLKTGQQKVKQR